MYMALSYWWTIVIIQISANRMTSDLPHALIYSMVAAFSWRSQRTIMGNMKNMALQSPDLNMIFHFASWVYLKLACDA